jgi:surface protein
MKIPRTTLILFLAASSVLVSADRILKDGRAKNPKSPKNIKAGKGKKRPKNVALTDVTIREAVTAWLEDEANATAIYGPINGWDTSLVTDMTSLFNDYYDYYFGEISFNDDLSSWDVSSVTNMSFMFCTMHPPLMEISLLGMSRLLQTWKICSVSPPPSMEICHPGMYQMLKT